MDSDIPSIDSDYLPLDLATPITSTSLAVAKHTEKCTVCGKPAFCYNYGVLTCNACKMFFRRVEVDQITYTCKYWNKCYEGHAFVDALAGSPRCRACRYQRCVDVGMKYIQPGKPELELSNKIEENLTSLIGDLLFLDARRRHKIFNFYTSENPTLREMITRGKGSRMVLKRENQTVQLHEWSFLGLYSAVELFLSLDFMEHIRDEDKIVLIKNYALQSMVFFSAMRSYIGNMDKVVNPDSSDVYPEGMYQLTIFSRTFLNGIRSRLVARCIELKLTNEEHVLLNMLLFCNPVHEVSEETRTIITSRQRVYSSALFKYCFLTYQQNGPSRFADLLSLCHVMNKQVEDINYLTTLFPLYMPNTTYKQLFVDVCHST
ncbi:hypothetical protein B9Z55_017887 [Caenorhabditis nigoni]|nr:hypothetical protein B9Z55_017887 [Caenorhabditis nigoni]